MKYKLYKLIILSALMLQARTIAAQASPALASQVMPTPLQTLSQQQDEVERIVDDKLRESAVVSDRVQNLVDARFDLLFDAIGLLVGLLAVTPLVSGAAFFIFKGAILEALRDAIAKEILKEDGKEILEKAKQQLSGQVKEDIEGNLLEFKKQLDQLVLAAEDEKKEYVRRLATLDTAIIRGAVTDIVSEKMRELENSPQLHMRLLSRLGRRGS